MLKERYSLDCGFIWLESCHKIPQAPGSIATELRRPRYVCSPLNRIHNRAPHENDAECQAGK
jgi:hypothetical protein